jgi:hypothetical protein
LKIPPMQVSEYGARALVQVYLTFIRRLSGPVYHDIEIP